MSTGAVIAAKAGYSHMVYAQQNVVTLMENGPVVRNGTTACRQALPQTLFSATNGMWFPWTL